MIGSRKVDDRIFRWMNIARSLGEPWRRLSGSSLPRLPQSATDCSPAGRVTFICGVTNVEDFAAGPGNKMGDRQRPVHGQRSAGILVSVRHRKKDRLGGAAVEDRDPAGQEDLPRLPWSARYEDVRPAWAGPDPKRRHAPHAVCRQSWRPGSGGSLHRRSVEIQARVHLEGMRGRTERLLARRGGVAAGRRDRGDKPLGPDRCGPRRQAQQRPAGRRAGRVASRQGLVAGAGLRRHVRPQRRDRFA